MAQPNGGREAGWIILDDLLSNPGILIAENEVTSCQEAVNLLQGKDLQGVSQEDDPAYALAIQLLTAQLNLAAGAESCQAAETAVQASQLLLLSIGFKGAGNYLASQSTDLDVQTALILTDQLSNYNTGALCR